METIKTSTKKGCNRVDLGMLHWIEFNFINFTVKHRYINDTVLYLLNNADDVFKVQVRILDIATQLNLNLEEYPEAFGMLNIHIPAGALIPEGMEYEKFVSSSMTGGILGGPTYSLLNNKLLGFNSDTREMVSLKDLDTNSEQYKLIQSMVGKNYS